MGREAGWREQTGGNPLLAQKTLVLGGQRARSLPEAGVSDLRPLMARQPCLPPTTQRLATSVPLLCLCTSPVSALWDRIHPSRPSLTVTSPGSPQAAGCSPLTPLRSHLFID